MTSETSIALAVFFGGALIVAGASLFPPLDAWETPQAPAESDLPAGVADDGGYAYCRKALTGVNCTCFADKAVHILSRTERQLPGWTYADRWDLARSQARNACS